MYLLQVVQELFLVKFHLVKILTYFSAKSFNLYSGTPEKKYYFLFQPV